MSDPTFYNISISNSNVLLNTLMVPFVIANQSLPQAKHPVATFKGFEGSKNKP